MNFKVGITTFKVGITIALLEGSIAMKSIVSEKGQVTIPKPVRDCLGLQPGVAVEFFEENGRLIGRKLAPDTDPVSAVTGIAQPIEIDKYLDDLRGSAE